MVNRWLCRLGLHKPLVELHPERWLITKRCADCGVQLPYARAIRG